jgi:hypothetical protein
MTKMTPKGMTTSAVKNFRMTISRLEGVGFAQTAAGYGLNGRERLRAGFGRPIVAIEAFAHFLAGLEERHALLIDGHMGAGARIAPRARRAMLDRESAEAAQLDAVAARQRCDDFIENRVYDVLDIPLVEVRVVLGDALNKLGFDHREWARDLADIHFRENALHCQDAKSILGGAK